MVPGGRMLNIEADPVVMATAAVLTSSFGDGGCLQPTGGHTTLSKSLLYVKGRFVARHFATLLAIDFFLLLFFAS